MYGNLTRKIREVYHGRKRNNRPAKLRKIQDDINDEVINSTTSSIVSAKSSREADLSEPASPSTLDGHGVRNADSVSMIPEASVQPLSSTETYQETFGQPILNASQEAFPPFPGNQDVLAPPEPESQQENIDEQAVRNATYLLFEGGDETDYTKGPSRMVYANDGVEECAGLLMTLDLSHTIQAAVRAQRSYKILATRARKIEDANFDFEEKLQTRMSDHEYRVLVLKEQDESDNEELKVVEAELTKLRPLMENTKARRRCISAELENEATNWREFQAEVNAYLEEAFVSAMLLEPAIEDDTGSPLEELTVEGEYEQLCRELQQSNQEEAAAIAPLHDYGEVFSPTSLSPEEQAQAQIKDEFWSAWQDLDAAQAAFDRREVDHARERQANMEADARGEQPMDDSPEAFDQRWLRRVQELTNDLVTAEEAMAAAKAKAQAAGVDVASYDQASGFIDDVEDGYRVSQEREIAASAPVPKITSWLSEVPSSVISPTFPDACENGDARADDWEADEIGLSDSASVVAEGAERKRIDKWRTACGL